MKNKKHGGGGKRSSSGARDATLHGHSMETTGKKTGVSDAYGMAKGPSQQMGGAAKKAAMPQKVKRASGASYAGSKSGSKPA